MKPPRTRLEQQQQSTEAQQSRQEAGREFDSVEEMLRYDVAQTTAPPAVGQRVQDSIQAEPKITRPWWRRLFSGS